FGQAGVPVGGADRACQDPHQKAHHALRSGTRQEPPVPIRQAPCRTTHLINWIEVAMTRETKIGLLVGLAFIIVIGILLSDHLTQTNEPQQAQLVQVAGNVRTGVAVPGGPRAPAASASAATPATQAARPQQTVLTKEELTPAKPPVEL